MVTIERGDIIRASMEAATSSKMMQLFDKAPMLMLLVPVIATEIEDIIFKEKKK